MPLPKRQAHRGVWLPAEHFQLLLEAAKESKSPLNLHDMLELNWELALRADEMITLEWHQVDFENRVLKIIEKPTFPTQFGLGWAPKWHQERRLPLTDKAIKILKRQPKRLTAGQIGKTDGLAPTNLIFPKRARWEGKMRYLRSNSIKKAWQFLVKRAGLKPFGYQWHDMRRSWNRLAAERGIPVAYRAAFLGHREDVNEANYETELAVKFMLDRMGESMRPTASEQASTSDSKFQTTVPVLFQSASRGSSTRRK